jgi:hypothetical protein
MHDGLEESLGWFMDIELHIGVSSEVHGRKKALLKEIFGRASCSGALCK